jgi:P-type Cu+ transporter
MTDHTKLSASSLPILTGAPHIDPVCGMTVDPASAAGSLTHEGVAYYFCSRSCEQRFRAEPQKFLAAKLKEHSCCHHEHGETNEAQVAAQALDPVCGMTVTPEKAAGRSEYHGQTYYFCGKRCQHKF